MLLGAGSNSCFAAENLNICQWNGPNETLKERDLALASFDQEHAGVRMHDGPDGSGEASTRSDINDGLVCRYRSDTPDLQALEEKSLAGTHRIATRDERNLARPGQDLRQIPGQPVDDGRRRRCNIFSYNKLC